MDQKSFDSKQGIEEDNEATLTLDRDFCGVTVPVEKTYQGLEDHAWRKEKKTFVCYRPLWNNTGRCIWHAPINTKSLEDLIQARTQSPQRLDGAVLDGFDFTDRISFSECTLGTGSLSGADFSGGNLSKAYLWYTDLSKAVLRNANLSDADFWGANLSEVNFRYATLARTALRESNLRRAILRDADLTNAKLWRADLSDADAEEVDLTAAGLREAIVSRTRLEKAKLIGADLLQTNLSKVNFRGADLSEAHLREADLTDADLQRAVLTDADLSESKLEGAIFTKAVLRGAQFRRTNLQKAVFRSVSGDDDEIAYADLRGADFSFADFTNTQFRADDFSGAIFDEARFNGADLSDSVFTHTKFHRAVFSASTISGADFNAATATAAIFDGANCRNVRFDNTVLDNASFIDADLRNATFTNAKIVHADFDSSKINRETKIANVDFGGGDSPSNQESMLDRLERTEWTHLTVQRLLMKMGRIHEARDGNHYLKAQRARIKRARIEGAYWRELKLRLGEWLIRTGENPLILIPIALSLSVVFAVIYYLFGGIGTAGTNAPSTGAVYQLSQPLSPRTGFSFWQLLLFSLVTLLSGTYGFLEAAIPYGETLLGTFSPFGSLFQEWGGVDPIEPITEAAKFIVAIEALFGVLLLIPFLLLLIKQLKLYLIDDEGHGSVVLAWLSAR